MFLSLAVFYSFVPENITILRTLSLFYKRIVYLYGRLFIFLRIAIIIYLLSGSKEF